MFFVNDEELYKKVKSIQPSVPSVTKIFSFDKVDGIDFWKDILSAETASLEEVKTIAAKIKFEDVATIIYTSGTTGKPKGVMLSHKNILSNVLDSMPCFPPGDKLKALSFLPLNHIFERIKYLLSLQPRFF